MVVGGRLSDEVVVVDQGSAGGPVNSGMTAVVVVEEAVEEGHGPVQPKSEYVASWVTAPPSSKEVTETTLRIRPSASTDTVSVVPW